MHLRVQILYFRKTAVLCIYLNVPLLLCNTKAQVLFPPKFWLPLGPSVPSADRGSIVCTDGQMLTCASARLISVLKVHYFCHLTYPTGLTTFLYLWFRTLIITATRIHVTLNQFKIVFLHLVRHFLDDPFSNRASD
jgi:hypothetical protein